MSIHETGAEDPGASAYVLVMKGAPERVLEACDTILLDGETLDLTDQWRSAFREAYAQLGGLGERVLGFCDLELSPEDFPQVRFPHG